MRPVDSCQGAPSACFSLSLSFLDFFLRDSGSAEPALLSPTIDHAAPAPAGVDTGSIGSGLLSTGWTGAGTHSSSAAGGAGGAGGGGLYAGSDGANGGGAGGGAKAGPTSHVISAGAWGGRAGPGPAAVGPPVAGGAAVLASSPRAADLFSTRASAPF